MRRSLPIVLASLALVASGQASACDIGRPEVVTFRNASPMPDRNGDILLESFASWHVDVFKNDTVRLVVYNPGVGGRALWQARTAEARKRLVKYGVPSDHVVVASTDTIRGMAGNMWIGRKTKMTVEFVKGCGG